MLVSKDVFLDALMETKDLQIIIRTIDRSRALSKQRFKIGDLKKYKNTSGDTSLAVILIPECDSCVSVVDIQALFGIKLENSLKIDGKTTDVLIVDSGHQEPYRV
jgi:hypothetical protein